MTADSPAFRYDCLQCYTLCQEVGFAPTLSSDELAGSSVSQEVLIDFWAKLNNTKTERVVTISRHTTAHYYKDGANGNEVWHYKIRDFGHAIPTKEQAGLNAVEVIWEFFSKR